MATSPSKRSKPLRCPVRPGRLTEVLVDEHGLIGSPSERHGLLYEVTLAALTLGVVKHLLGRGLTGRTPLWRDGLR